jgi:hypothetical protein
MVERHRDRLDDVFAAIGETELEERGKDLAIRSAIVQMLVRRPATISQIARPFPVSFNAVSKHMMA